MDVISKRPVGVTIGCGWSTAEPARSSPRRATARRRSPARSRAYPPDWLPAKRRGGRHRHARTLARPLCRWPARRPCRPLPAHRHAGRHDRRGGRPSLCRRPWIRSQVGHQERALRADRCSSRRAANRGSWRTASTFPMASRSPSRRTTAGRCGNQWRLPGALPHPRRRVARVRMPLRPVPRARRHLHGPRPGRVGEPSRREFLRSRGPGRAHPGPHRRCGPARASPACWVAMIARLCSVSASIPIEAARQDRNPNPMWMPQLSKCPAQATHKLHEIFLAMRRSSTNVRQSADRIRLSRAAPLGERRRALHPCARKRQAGADGDGGGAHPRQRGVGRRRGRCAARSRAQAAPGHADLLLQQHRGLSQLRCQDAVQVAHDRRGFQPHLGPARPAGHHGRDPAGAGGEALRRARRLPARPPFDARRRRAADAVRARSTRAWRWPSRSARRSTSSRDAGHAAGMRMRDYGGFGDPKSPKNALADRDRPALARLVGRGRQGRDGALPGRDGHRRGGGPAGRLEAADAAPSSASSR